MSARSDHLGDGTLGLGGQAEVKTRRKHQRAREDITKHHSEQEREGDRCEKAGVDFFVGWDLILIDDQLADGGELTLSEIGWDSQLRVDFALLSVDDDPVVTRKLIFFLEELFGVLGGHPDETSE